ncbi:site-specific integrase [uncultured Dysosmobacter sp.]|uniref:tyrosine-type recombinase/integrase n=1 Tax=uncultured Dysosmobacter sp. TaxID=2591384 RepID=UPI0026190DDE|nr:site-specific integrase [uncultured Dysosmobacter sp.]
MAKRRPSGDGMVRRRDDGRWEGRIVVGHKANGDSIFRYVYAPTQKELSAKLRQRIDTYQGVDLTEQSRMTLSEWLDQWLVSVEGTVRPTTFTRYRGTVENHLKPYLGNRKLSQLTAKDIQRLYETLAKEGRQDGQGGLSSGTIRGIHAVFHGALKAARQANLIAKNPIEELEPPKFRYRDKQVLTDEQLDVFMKIITEDEIWHDFFYTELTTGMRRGEICGLKWEDFDEVNGTLNVRRTVHVEKGGKRTTWDTKTSAGSRTITLPSSTVELLRDRRQSAPSDWIFPDPLKPEEPTSPGSAYSRLKTLLRKAGLPSIPFHALRHTFATHALSSGVDAKTLSGILGHTRAGFTLDTYTHTTGDMQKRAAEIVEEFMTDIFGKELRPWEENAKTARAPSD